MWGTSFPYLFQLGSFREVQKSLLGDPLSVSFMLKLFDCEVVALCDCRWELNWGLSIVGCTVVNTQYLLSWSTDPLAALWFQHCINKGTAFDIVFSER
jgi:hypothetical protein